MCRFAKQFSDRGYDFLALLWVLRNLDISKRASYLSFLTVCWRSGVSHGNPTPWISHVSRNKLPRLFLSSYLSSMKLLFAKRDYKKERSLGPELSDVETNTWPEIWLLWDLFLAQLLPLRSFSLCGLGCIPLIGKKMIRKKKKAAFSLN